MRRLRSVHAQVVRSRSGPIAYHLSPLATMFALAKTVTVWAAVSDEASVSAQTWAWASVWALE